MPCLSRPLDKRRKARQIAPMENDNLPGLSPLWLILLATLLGAFLPFMVAATTSADQIKPADWIGFSGSVLTTGVAAAAIYYAWKGIIRQLRIGLISREEDRIERELPGLRDARERLGDLLAKLGSAPPGGDEILQLYNLGIDSRKIVQEIEAIFPSTDDRTRRRIAQLFSIYIPNLSQAELVQTSFWKAEYRMKAIADFDPSEHEDIRAEYAKEAHSFRQRMGLVHDNMAALEGFRDEIAARIETLERVLPNLRSEIEQFFGR
jgi:hypothetical protein